MPLKASLITQLLPSATRVTWLHLEHGLTCSSAAFSINAVETAPLGRVLGVTGRGLARVVLQERRERAVCHHPQEADKPQAPPETVTEVSPLYTGGSLLKGQRLNSPG